MNEHQSNGVVERAVQTVGGMIRTQKLALEYTGASCGDPMVDHACGSDGLIV